MSAIKIFYFILFTLVISLVTAQDKTVRGQFIGENLDKSYINVININQYKATISQLDGKFEIEAKAGDSILISSIQYDEIKFVVKPEFFDETIEIPLRLKVNALEEVNLYSLGLTGDLQKDAESIKTDNSAFLNTRNFDVSNVYDEGVTTQSEFSLRNIAMEQNPIPASLDVKKVIGLLKKTLNPQKRKANLSNFDIEKANKLNDISFLINTLNIEESQIGHFISYAQANGLTIDLLHPSKELDLIEFLLEISKAFKDEYEK